MHKVLSLETNDLQKAGAKASMNGLSDELLKNNRFTDVKPLNLDLRSYGAGIFPSALPWVSVDRICGQEKAMRCSHWNCLTQNLKLITVPHQPISMSGWPILVEHREYDDICKQAVI
jgi:hypothetical protein